MGNNTKVSVAHGLNVPNCFKDVPNFVKDVSNFIKKCTKLSLGCTLGSNVRSRVGNNLQFLLEGPQRNI